MKLLWNSLLLSVGILLSTSTSIVLAQSPKTSESAVRTASTFETSPVLDSTIPAADILVTTSRTNAQVPRHEQITPSTTAVTEEAVASPIQTEVNSTAYTDQEAFTINRRWHLPSLVEAPSSNKRIIAVALEEPTIPSGSTRIPIKHERVNTTAIALTGSNAITLTGSNAIADTPQILIASTPTAQETTVPTQTNTPHNNNPATETQAPNPTNAPQKPPTAKDSTDTKEPEPSPEELAKRQKLIEADNLWQSGKIEAAEKLYREAKDPFKTQVPVKTVPDPITDPAKLPAAGAVYWRMSEEGLQQRLETKTMIPLQLLVKEYPQFIPGQLRYAQVLKDYNQPKASFQVLEQVATLYPNQPDVAKAKIAALSDRGKWVEASLAARRFALLHPNDPQSQEFTALADENLERYKRHLRRKLRGNTIANAITGALGFVFAGDLFGPISAVDSTVMLLRGESAVGKSAANQVKRQLPIMQDEQVLSYLREVGDKLAKVAGRNDFQYEFNVVMDDDLNAFALPGGKVFVNAGAILRTKSEAELAGLMAHELSHAVLSHGFQLATEGNLTANVAGFVPYGGILGNLLVLNYSRDMERQADELGTQILAGSGYAADGLRNLMVTLDKQERDRPLFSWLSDHPDTKNRVKYLETLIEQNGYNRYAYEGIARHLEIQKRVRELMKQYKERKHHRQH